MLERESGAMMGLFDEKKRKSLATAFLRVFI
jgi:hypothetical protein